MIRQGIKRTRTRRVKRIIAALPGRLSEGWTAFEDLVHPPQNLLELPLVADRLGVVAREIPRDAKPRLARQLKGMARAVKEVADQAARAGVSFEGEASKSKAPYIRPFFRYIAQHPLYCQLGFPNQQPLDDAADRGHARLQAHLLVLVLALGDKRPSDDFSSAIKTCGEAIREYQAYEKYHAFLRALGRWDNRIEDFSARLQAQIDRGTYPHAHKAQRGYRTLVKYLGGAALRKPSGPKKTPGVRQPAASVPVDRDPHAEEPPETETRPARASRGDRKKARETGASPGDVADRPLTARSSSRLHHGRGETPAQMLRAQRRQRRALATRNQRLPLAPDRLAGPQLRALFADLDECFDPARDRPRGRGHRLRALAELVFWTGSTVDEVLASHVASAAERLRHPTDRHLDPEHGWWLVPAPALDHQAQAAPAWAGDMRVADGYIALPLPRRLRDLLAPLLPGAAHGRRLLFQGTGEHGTLRDRLTWLLRALNDPEVGGRITPHRLAFHRLYTLYDRTGDLAEAALITGRTRSLGLDSPLYYHAPWLRDLAGHYHTACQGDLERLGLARGQRPSRAAIRQLPEKTTVGVEVCPRRPAVRRFVQDLAARAASAPRAADFKPGELCEWHNRLTAYVAALVLWATGHRVVGGPVCDRAHIAGEFLMIDDKQGAFGGDPRPVWLPTRVRDQLETYGRHAAAVLGRLVGRLPEAVRSYLLGLVHGSSAVPYLFYLDYRPPSGRLTIEALGAGHYRDLLAPIVPWPVNVHRHYLRTHLREAGVNGEVVDAFMGHRQIGSEPLGRFSSLGPTTVARDTRPVIESLLGDAGWTVLPGLAS